MNRLPEPNRAVCGILAFGSLIWEPGELEKLNKVGEVICMTPWPVEFARSSQRRHGAPTLVRVREGDVVRARVFVYHDEVDTVRAALASREEIDLQKHPDYVAQCEVSELNLKWIFYTALPPNITDLRPQHLAELALASARDCPEKNGILYLRKCLELGTNTALSSAYHHELLRMTGCKTLREAEMAGGIVENDSLPAGWRRAKLKEVCRVVSGSTPQSGVSAYWDGEIAWITPTDLGRLSGTEIHSSERRITKAGYESCGTELVPAGSVVISSRAPIGHLGIARVPLCTNQGCKSFVPGQSLDAQFLFFSLKQAVPVLQQLGSETTFREVSKTHLENFEISLPPLAEQKRIASILKGQMAAIARARAASEAQLEAARALPAGYLREAFNRITPLSVSSSHDPAPSGWKWMVLTEIAQLESGHTPSRRHPEWWGGDIPWLALPDIRALDGKVVSDTSEHTNEQGIANSSARVLPADTVCLSRTASVGFVTIMGRPMATSQDFVNWVCGPDLDPHFLAYLLRAARTYILSLGSGSVHKTVYVPTVKAFKVCVPARPEQEIITETLREQIGAAEHLSAELEAELKAIDGLPSALLRRALNGEL